MISFPEPQSKNARVDRPRLLVSVFRRQMSSLRKSKLCWRAPCVDQAERRMWVAVTQERKSIPTLEIEVSPICDSMIPTLRTRLEAVIETVKEGRKK